MQPFTIVIPCYNEAKRLIPECYISFFRTHPEVRFIFVDDGSKDTTGLILQQIRQSVSGTEIITLAKNSGKGEAVRQGILFALTQDTAPFIGYIDADLSTSLEHFYKIKEAAEKKKADIVLGTRIKKIDTNIQRSFYRHFIGRIIATIIDLKFKLGIYDTQCGAKVFQSDAIHKGIQKEFLTRWFFDVEIFLRLKNNISDIKIHEIPLKEWKNVKGSKINILSFPRIAKDLLTLLTKY